MPNLTTLSSISMPSTCLLTATVESNTINNTANRSSTTKIPNTTPANRWLRNPMSSNALKIIVVEDIDNIPPRKRLFICPQPSDKPVIYPAVIIPITTVMAPMTAVPPTFINFLKLKSSPKANNRKITPISAQIRILSTSVTVGICSMEGPASIPATIYPNTTGRFNFLNNRVTNPADMSMTARSDISAGI